MSRYMYGNWRPYVPVAERRRRAARKIARMVQDGRQVSPVVISGRTIATTFWGKAWCRNLEAYSDFSNRLPRGRTYVRNGSVLDLQIENGRVRSLVSGTDIYQVEIEIARLQSERWTDIKRQCTGEIGSLVELLQGSLSRGVMEIVTRKGEGLFPSPLEISLSCSCPDWATMCKHVAATMYGVGARLDHLPELLFLLRGVDPLELVESAIDRPVTADRPTSGRRLASDELSSVFGVDIDTSGSSTAEREVPSARASRKPSRTARLSREALERLQDRALEFATDSAILRQLLHEIELSRGRLYLKREAGEKVARITPLGPRSMLLEYPAGRFWKERKRGSLTAVLRALESESQGR